MANDSRPPVPVDDSAVPFPARKAMQDAIWRECIAPGENEWTTWSDSVTLAECAAKALHRAGWQVVPMGDAAATDDLRSAAREFALAVSAHGLDDLLGSRAQAAQARLLVLLGLEDAPGTPSRSPQPDERVQQLIDEGAIPLYQWTRQPKAAPVSTEGETP